nr:Gamma-aminobutyrate permease [Klebsiella pneumoniae]
MIAFITFVLVVMLFRPAQQLEVISTGLLALGIICTVPIMSRWKSWYCGKTAAAKYALTLFPAPAGRVFRSKNMTAIPGRRPLTDTVG